MAPQPVTATIEYEKRAAVGHGGADERLIATRKVGARWVLTGNRALVNADDLRALADAMDKLDNEIA